MKKTDRNYDIKSKIIIPKNCKLNLNQISDIELAAIYSKNTKNFNILKRLLKEIEKNEKMIVVDEILGTAVYYLDSTANFNAVKLLINYGADINYIDSFGHTYLSDCCLWDTPNIKIINFLIENGANVNINKNSLQPLTIMIMYCSEYSDLEIIKLLIRKGADVNHRDSHFEMPLMICCEKDNDNLFKYDLIKLLLDNKADVYIKNKKSKNILNVIEDNIHKNSKIYSLIFNYKNIKGDHFCEFDIDFIY